ncbi:MAG: hypothetical protein ACC614_05985 [Methanobacterium formicicum]|uniref:hypothetical protein n=1 Tax=Methanobacterium formicicum TaxID=2162 RepID=UPI0035314AC6
MGKLRITKTLAPPQKTNYKAINFLYPIALACAPRPEGPARHRRPPQGRKLLRPTLICFLVRHRQTSNYAEWVPR